MPGKRVFVHATDSICHEHAGPADRANISHVRNAT
jgi:hypothetical protein